MMQSSGGTIMIDEIRQEALEKARTRLAFLFSDAQSLDNTSIAVIRSQLTKSLAQAESNINMIVQTKLDSLKRVVDLMEDSSTKLDMFTTNLIKIDERIATTHSTLSDYQHLKNVDKARDNIQKLINQVEFFIHVPEIVEKQRQILDTDETKLKEIFIESLKLESLRSAIMTEVRISHSRHKGGTLRPASTDSSDVIASSTLQEKIRSSVENHLNIIPKLSKEILSRLYSNIERMFDLAIDRPENLVLTFEVLEMYQQYIDRKTADKNTVGVENLSVKIKQEIKNRILMKLNEKVESGFLLMDGGAEDNPNSTKREIEIKDLLDGATSILNNISQFRFEVLPCIPPDYESLNMYVSCLDAELLPRIEEIANDIVNLDVADVLFLVQWFEFYATQLVNFGYENHRTCELFADISENLLNEYLNRIKQQVLAWFTNIKSNPPEIVKDSNGFLITSQPEDMINIIHVQIAVAKEKLPKKDLHTVIQSCLNVLRELQRNQYDELTNTWREITVETLCSIINDNERMQDKCGEFSDLILTLIPQPDQQTLLTAILEEVANEYISIGVAATNFLARNVLKDLDEPVFSKLFTDDWEEGDKLLDVLTATLDDYLKDILQWLPEFFYNKFMQHVFNQVILLYMLAIRKHAIVLTSTTNSSNIFFPHSFQSEVNAASKISNDYQILLTFFNSFNAIISSTHSIVDELEPLKELAHLTMVSRVEGIEDVLRSLYTRFGKEGLTIVTAAICCNPSMQRPEKLNNIKLASDLFFKKEKEYPVFNELFKGISAIESAINFSKLKEILNKPNKNRLKDWITGKKDDKGDY